MSITTPDQLMVGVGLGLPASVVPSPPDPAAIRVAVQTIYRLYITGGDWLEIPLISFQCQRRLGASTWMTAIVGYTSALRNALDARLALDGRMSLFYGVRYSDGSEQLGEVMQAALTQIDEEREPYRGTLTIRGRVITPSYASTSRVLQAVSARGRDDQGRRTCACAVDPLLRPNDTVHDGVNEWTAGVIQYDISPSAALMRVLEV